MASALDGEDDRDVRAPDDRDVGPGPDVAH